MNIPTEFHDPREKHCHLLARVLLNFARREAWTKGREEEERCTNK